MLDLDVEISRQSSGLSKKIHFSSDFENKRLYYSGYNKSHLNELAQNEFSKDTDVIYSSYRSPVNINVFYVGKY